MGLSFPRFCSTLLGCPRVVPGFTCKRQRAFYLAGRETADNAHRRLVAGITAGSDEHRHEVDNDRMRHDERLIIRQHERRPHSSHRKQRRPAARFNLQPRIQTAECSALRFPQSSRMLAKGNSADHDWHTSKPSSHEAREVSDDFQPPPSSSTSSKSQALEANLSGPVLRTGYRNILQTLGVR